MTPLSPQPFYKMKASGKTARIDIYDQIGSTWLEDGVSAKQFSKDLIALGEIAQIELHVNSPGGSVFDAIAIYNQLRAHPATINVTIDALAASAASVIILAGETIEMPNGALVMIHDPMTYAGGNAQQLEKAVETLRTIKESILDIYETRTGTDRATLARLMKAETWMDGEDALKWGFATHLSHDLKVAATLEGFTNQEFYLRQYRPPLAMQPLLSSPPEYPVSVIPIKETPMSPEKPVEKEFSMTKEQLESAIQEALQAQLKAQLSPAMAQLEADRLNIINSRFQALAASGNILPAQATLFQQLSKVMLNSVETVEMNGVPMKPVEALLELASTLQHSLLREQINDTRQGASGAVADTRGTGVLTRSTGESFKPDFTKMDDRYSGKKAAFALNQYIQDVILSERPEMKYADALDFAMSQPHVKAFYAEHGGDNI